MTKSTKPETPAYNWALINKRTGGLAAELFDTRREAEARCRACIHPGAWRVARVQLREVKRVAK